MSAWTGRWFRDVWLPALTAGVRLTGRKPGPGLRALYDPVSYWRTAELSYVLRSLEPISVSEGRLFDLGSPKVLGLLLTQHLECTVVTCDIWRKEVKETARYARGLGARILATQQDGRCVSHPSDAFDAATSVSVLEHIPDGGDTEAMRELTRIVRPGGLIVGTVPYAESAGETWVDRDVYSRTSNGERIFYQRRYDLESFRERLVDGVPVRLEGLEIWAERARVESVLRNWRLAKYLTPPVQPLLARLFLRNHAGDADRGALFFTLVVS